jgi:hypothetical protein
MYQSIWNWIQQKSRPKKIFEMKKKNKEFIIDETIKIGSELIDMALGCGLLITIGFESKEILGTS